MANSRRVLSVVLSIVMVLTIIPMGLFSTASAVVAANDAVLDTATSLDNGTGKLVTPIVTLVSTPVFRIANSGNVFLGGNTLVPATDSGLPEITGNYTSQYYAGETPHGYTVVLTSDKVLAGTPSLGCSVPGVTISAPVKSGNTYTWTITNGSASFSVGEVQFTADYTYSYTDSLSGKSVTTQYNAYSSSYAENVTNGAGMLLYRTRKAAGTAHEREHMKFLHRILGANTYASFTGGSTAYEAGYFNFVSNGWQSGSYVGMHYKDGDNDSSDGTEYYSSGLDRRALATTYVDRDGSAGAPLSRNNLRYSFYEAENRSNYKRYVRGLIVIPGLSGFNVDTTHNNAAGTQIGLDEITSGIEVNGNSETHFNMTGSTYNDAATQAENGNLVSQYTVIGNAGTTYSKTDRISNSKIGVSLEIQSYDKSELRAFLNELLCTDQYEPTSPALDSGIGINPQGSQNTNWYKAGFSSYIDALHAAQRIIAKPDTNQNEIDLAYTNLETAVAGLEVREADTTQLDLALAEFAQKDASKYTDDAWNAVLDAYDAAVATDGYSVFYQCAVDKAVDDLNKALAALENNYAEADWSEVDELIEVYEELGADAFAGSTFKYTTDSWNLLRDAVTYAQNEKDSGNYKVTEQALIHAMAVAIADAIDGLQPAGADYTAYDAQVARYNDTVLPQKAAIEASLAAAGIDLATLGIANIYDATSWKRVQANLNIDRDYKYYEQEDVDDYTAALKKAIDNLTLVNAVYAGVDDALELADAEDSSWYTAESWAVLEDAVGAVVEGYKIDKQPEVNAMAQAILDALDGLEEADANYDEFDRLAAIVDGLDASIYTEDSYNAVVAAVDNIYNNHYNHTAKEQAVLNTEVAKIQTAINALVELPADYTAVDAAIARWNNFADKDKYTAASVAEVGRVIGLVDRTKKISQQAAVDKMAEDINAAIDNLQAKPADYSALKTALQNAKAEVTKQNSFAANNGGKGFYTADSFAALTAAVAAVPVDANGNVTENKTIFQQADVDAMTTALNNAIAGLKPNGADFSDLEAALATVPSDEDLENENLYVPETVVAVNVAVIEANAALDSREDYTVEDQADIDALAKAVRDAVAGLRYLGADYDALLAEMLNVPADLSIYTADSVSALNAALAAIPKDAEGKVLQNKTILEQGEVDALTSNLHNAIAGLTPDMADYTAVDAAIAAADAETAKGIYTDDSVAAVTAAKDAVVRGKYAKDQADVDAMAQAIDDAVKALQEKGLDLTSYNAAVARIPADLSIYTAASVNAMNDAKAAADMFKSLNNKITKQDDFEIAVKALDDAITALELNAADYSLVEEYKTEASKLVKANYVDFSAVDAAIAAVVYDLPGTQQADVDAMAQAIRDAIDALVEKPLDLTNYNAAVASVPTDLELRTDASVAAMNAAKDAADAFKADENTNKISKQAQFDALVATYATAIENLEYKPADYSALDALVEEVEALNPDDYENYDEIYWGYLNDYIYSTVADNHDFDITKQSDVDAMVDELQSYIDMLIGLPADWSAVDAKVAEAEAEIAKGIYTDDSVAALQDVLDSIDRTLDRAHQADIDAYVPVIDDALNNILTLKDADYTELEALIDYVNTLADNFGVDEDGTVFVNFDDIYWTYIFEFVEGVGDYYGLKADQQSVVDGLTAQLQSYVDMLETEGGDEPAV
ncbi:MAG: hypothetical protein MJ168_10520, partial [Clostridia bacterium]|nr:hypothetical protein [Clostridia bacterium]